MKRIVWCLAIVAVIMVAGSSAARADMVYNFGSPNQAGGAAISSPFGTTVAQSFGFGGTGTTQFNEITFWAFAVPGGYLPLSDTVNYSIYTSSSGVPGTLTDSGMNVNVSEMTKTLSYLVSGSTTPTLVPEYEVTFDIPTFTATNGTTYWLALDMGGRFVDWETSNAKADPGLTIGSSIQSIAVATWIPTSNTYAFELAAVPLPSAVLFLAPGLAGLAFLRKRFKG